MKKLLALMLSLLLCVSLLPALPQTGCAAAEAPPSAGLVLPQDPDGPEDPDDPGDPQDPEDPQDPGRPQKPGEVRPQDKDIELDITDY